jgi:hypothetical protein
LSFGEGFAALGALVDLIRQSIIDQVIRKVDPIEADREIIDELKVPVVTVAARKVILYVLHSTSLPPCGLECDDSSRVFELSLKSPRTRCFRVPRHLPAKEIATGQSRKELQICRSDRLRPA